MNILKFKLEVIPANIPSQDGYIELHIKLYEIAISQWLQETSIMGTQIRLRGPFGKCYYYNPEKWLFDMLHFLQVFLLKLFLVMHSYKIICLFMTIALDDRINYI
ncbi:TPA: FAD-binding oxidoreductase [Legionella anisa]|uniref:FAD-binding oxidoreductase n=1 Tax=Legionella anisa TaxID=28082 RepID=UPI001374723B|nr:FAD-binding oxidoreductase [Legionella anisa]MBN5936556.1 hypothetical protein [Legionella anisa]UAK81534.1 hypothetical protein K8O89_18590 [Legionella anisa]